MCWCVLDLRSCQDNLTGLNLNPVKRKGSIMVSYVCVDVGVSVCVSECDSASV